MQLNWGAKITIVYCVFVLFILGLVYLCSKQHFDLVSNNYYAHELKFQEVIDGTQNAKHLGQKIMIGQTKELVHIDLPAATTDIENGQVYFYRPSDASKDLKLPFASKQLNVSKLQLVSGAYKVIITWDSNGKKYFDEQSLFVRK